MLTELPRVVPDQPDRPDLGDLARRMRALTLEIASDTNTWTPERAAQMIEFFDSLAATWPDRDTPERHAALGDALARAGRFPDGLCLEVGAGSGNATGDLRAAFDDVVSIDLSREMLSSAAASTSGRQVRADASALPVRGASVAVVALVNMFLFPGEVARVLQADGVVLWVSTNGDATPIYLSPAEVLDALPGGWHGISAQAGWGTWLAARREHTTPAVLLDTTNATT